MKILLTNDDGIEAQGLKSLEKIMERFGEVFVVAPNRQYSGCGHQVTFGGPIEIGEPVPGRFWVDGTPADCVRLGISELVGPVDWVVSGINEGSNLGNDVFMSGTVAAAREAAWLETPAIALSQYHRDDHPSLWDWAEYLTANVLEKFLQEKPQQFRFWNINLPKPPNQATNGRQLPSIRVCDLDPTPLTAEYRSDGRAYFMANDYHERPRMSGHDVDVCFNGEISVTLV